MLEPVTDLGEFLSPAELALAVPGLPAQVTLQRSVRGELSYVFTDSGVRKAVSARDGSRLVSFTVEDALNYASEHWQGSQPRWLETRSEPDQWTVYGKYKPYFPLHVVELGDPEGRVAYFCKRSGEVVQVTSRAQRAWAWMGAIPHWVYFTPIREHTMLWRIGVIAVSLFAMIGALAGWVLGLARSYTAWRRSNTLSPFRAKRWFQLHHLSGLCFGPLVVTWLLSGALSLIPFEASPDSPSHPDRLRREFVGGVPSPKQFSEPVSAMIARCDHAGIKTRRMQFKVLGTRAYYLCEDIETSKLGWLQGGEVHVADQIPLSHLDAAGAAIGVGAQWQAHALPDGDEYVFHRRHSDPTVGLVKVASRDASLPSIYVSASRAEIVAILDFAGRAHRWLYHGLHNLDFRPLYDHPSVWLCLILVMLAGGSLTSFTATRLSTRTLFRRRNRQRRDLSS